MKIMYMAPRYHTNQVFIMKGWIDKGHQVNFISQYVGGIEDYQWIKPTVIGYSLFFKIIEFIYVHLISRKNPYAADLKLKYGLPPMIRLLKCIKKIRPDVAILRERSFYTMIAYAICRYYKIPVILYNQSPLMCRGEKMDLFHKIVWKLTPEYRITPTYQRGKDLSGFVNDKKAYWVPFVMEPQVSPEEKIYFREGRINILCIGKYQERKNHQMMIEVVEEMACHYPLHVTIAGEISSQFHELYYQKIKKYVEEHNLVNKVTFCVNLDRKAIYEEYRKADLFILPSTGEPAAVSLLEAMAFSLPVISGSDNGTASYIKEGITGYVFENNNKKDLQDKMKKIICCRDTIQNMGAASYHHLQEHFQFTNYYSQIAVVLRAMGYEMDGL